MKKATKLFCYLLLSFLWVISNIDNSIFAQEVLMPQENEKLQNLSNSQQRTIPIELEEYKKRLKTATATESARLIREFVEKYKINIDLRQELPGIIDPQQVEVNQTLFRAADGLEQSIQQRVSQAKLEKLPEVHKRVVEEPIVVLIQLSRTMSLRERLLLFDSDIKIYEEKALTLIAKLPVGVVRIVANMPFVRWIGEFKPEYKYSADRQISMKKWVFIYPLDEGTDEHENDLRNLGIRIEKYYPNENLYIVETNESEFPRIAQLWWVRWIQREPMEYPEGIYFEPDDSREFISAFKSSYTGAGVRVGIRDTGIWDGNTIDFPNGSIFTLGTFGDTDGHGTHVSGIIVARGRETTYRGVSYGATLYMAPHSAGTYQDAFRYFSDNSVLVSNHSYRVGLTGNSSYDDDTKSFDGYADNGLIIVKSAGNEYSSGTITNPGYGKNIITVGAIQYVKDASFERVIGDVANYSSRGPTQDGRLKPDIVAPGGQTVNDYEYYKNGVVSTSRSSNWLDNNTWPDNNWYYRMSGTSQAAPHVTGIAAKALQWDSDLRSHSFKATLINNAIPIKANTNSSLSGYANTNVGYGLANGFSITNFYSGEEQTLLFISGDVNSLTNSEDNHTVTVPTGVKKFAVTLAYDDEEGAYSNTKHIKDDLDLILISPSGTEYNPKINPQNYKPAGVTGESPIEKMVIENPAAGNWTVRIKIYWYSGIYASQIYAVHAKAIFKTPALSVTASPATIYKGRAQSLDVTPTVTNTGGHIAAGVNLEISSSPSGFTGEIKTNKYVDNLMYQNASASKTFSLITPTTDDSYTLNIIASGINLGLSDASTSVTVVVDGMAPPAPISLAATPSGWTNTNSFSINWTNPVDRSGVVAAWYKLGSPPTSGTDGTRTTDKPFTVSASTAGGQVLYVWLEDKLGNKDYNNRSSTTLYYTGVSSSIAVTASLNPPSTTISQTVNVSGGAIYNTGNPVTSGTVTIEIIGGNSWTATLDANGNFSRNITAPASPGNYTVRTIVSNGTLSGFVDKSLSVLGGQGNPSAYQFYRATVCENVQSSTPYDPINETRWIRSSFVRVNVWVHLTYLYKSVRVKWEWYKPDGILWNTYYSDWTSDPQASGYLYWYWWKFSSNWTVSGTDLADMEGKWSVKVHVQASGEDFRYHDTQYFTIRYNFTEHKTAQDVQTSDLYLPINPTNTFYQTDTKALTWMNLDDVSEGMQVRWDYYEPNGSLYNTFSHTIPDPGIGYYHPWYRTWGWINITGNAAANKTGNWRAEVFIKDPFNNFDREYIDYFRILESPNVLPVISVGSPTSTVEGTNIGIPISVSDNGYIQKVELYWTDQTQHSSILADNVLKNSYSTTYNIGPYTEGTQVHYSVRAYDVSGNTAESSQRTITIVDSDTQGPEISNLKIEEYNGNGNGVIQDNEQVRISWTVSDPSGIKFITLSVDNQSSSIVDNAYSISGPYAAGTHQIQVIATDNDYSPTSSTVLSNFGVIVNPPAAPTLASPPEGATGISTSPTLSWNASSSATSYQLQVSTNSSFSTTVFNQNEITNTSQVVPGLANNTTYFWRVNATNGGGTSDWSSARNFTTVGSATIPIPLPAANAYGNIPGVDQSHVDKVAYSFPGRAGHLFLSYQAYDIDTKDEVKVLFNDTKVTNVALTANNKWSGNLGVLLRDALVNNTTTNIVVFDNSQNPPHSLTWGVRRVSVEGCFQLPSPQAYGKIPSGDQTHSDRVIYWFPGQLGDLNLTYEVYDIDDIQEVDILLNGVKIRDETTTANNNWSGKRTLLLPDALVNNNDANVLIFDNTKNPNNTWIWDWGVKNVSVAPKSTIAVNVAPSQEGSIAGNKTQELQYLFDDQATMSDRFEEAEDTEANNDVMLATAATTIAADGHLIISFPTIQSLDYLLLYPGENPQRFFCYRLEASPDGKEWQMLIDKTARPVEGVQLDQIPGIKMRFLRISGWSYACDLEELATDELNEETYWQAQENIIRQSTPMDLAIAELELFKQESLSTTATKKINLPVDSKLTQNFPNPFNAGTLIKYEIPQSGPVLLKIYNLDGQEIRTLVNTFQQPGHYQINWDGRDEQGHPVPSGLYMYRLQTDSFVQSYKMLMVR